MCAPIFLFLLQSEYEKLKGKQEEQLNARLESKTKDIEKIMMENERLRKDIKKVFFYVISITFMSVKLSCMCP